MSTPEAHYREQANSWREKSRPCPPTTHNEGFIERSRKGRKSSLPTTNGSSS